MAHSCVLLQVGDTPILTDPWFSERFAYHPGEPVAMTPEQLPDLDAVLVSHAHYDHCDFKAFAAYRDHGVPVIAARTVLKPAAAAGFTNVKALEEWQTAQLRDVKITAIPAKHAVYEIGFVIEGGGRTVYFAADTLLIPSYTQKLWMRVKRKAAYLPG
ncbi:MAG: MBL fold metallo-hydrolase [Solirubrobacteraceae bacterium]